MPTLTNTKRTGSGRIDVALIGCSHHTAPVEIRERVTFSPEQAIAAAEELRKRRILDEAVVLSTCNRSELYGVPTEQGPAAADAMEVFLTSFHGVPRADLNGRLYRWRGPDAVRHLFRVASGLDSMMLGEAEILGQLRAAYGQALEHGSTGPVLNRMFQGAIEVGKRVRSETEVGARPMSVALAGVKLAERVFGHLKGHSALILGAGAVAEQVVENLRNRGIGRLRVVNRSFDHAEELARKMGGEAIEWSSLERVLGVPDIVIASIGGTGAVLTRALLERAIAARDGQPMFVVDLGVPRNITDDAAGLYNLYLYNIDDLGEIVEQNKKARESEVPRAEAIIAEHIAKFESWRAALEAGSIVEDLRDSFHKHRESLIREKLAEMDDVSPEERARIARITEELIDRVLEQPSRKLRRSREMRGHLAGLDALRHLFGLDSAKEEDKD